MPLPPAFCWTKFGTEAAECVDSIIDRKESERLLNDGVFLWGIGSSIRPSLLALLELTNGPEVVFTPMIAAPARRDIDPPAVLVWRSATGMDGRHYSLPAYSVVTSAADQGRQRRRHYALVCRRAVPLDSTDEETWLDHSAVRNLRLGTTVGSSQVTSVVRHENRLATAGRGYRIAFRASLVYPYLVTLSDALTLPSSLRLDRVPAHGRREALEVLRSIAGTSAAPQTLLWGDPALAAAST